MRKKGLQSPRVWFATLLGVPAVAVMAAYAQAQQQGQQQGQQDQERQQQQQQEEDRPTAQQREQQREQQQQQQRDQQRQPRQQQQDQQQQQQQAGVTATGSDRPSDESPEERMARLEEQRMQRDEQRQQQTTQQLEQQWSRIAENLDQQFSYVYPAGDRDTGVLAVDVRTVQTARRGGDYPYEIRVENITENPLAGVTIIQSLGEELEFDRATMKSKAGENNQQRWVIGALEPGESKSIKALAIPKGEGNLGVCLAFIYEPALCTSVEIVEPDLEITKRGPESAYICEDFEYTYVVRNTGTGTARDVIVEDQLPQGLETADGENSVRREIGDLPEGETEEFRIALQPQREGEFSSRAVAHSEAGSARSDDVRTVVRDSELRVTAEGPEWQYSGESVTFKVTVENVGEHPALDTMLAVAVREDNQLRQQQQGQQQRGQQQQDRQRQGQQQQERQQQAQQQDRQQQERQQQAQQQDRQQQAQQQQGQQQQRDVGQQQERQQMDMEPDRQRNLGDLAPGETRTMNFTVPTNGADRIGIVARAMSVCANDDDRQAVARVATNVRRMPALLLETIDNVDPVRIGENTVYTIKVKNQGDAPATNVTLTAELPSELSFVEVTGDTEAQHDGGMITFDPAQEIPPGEVLAWRLVAKAEQAGDVRLRTELNSDFLDSAVPDVEPTRLH